MIVIFDKQENEAVHPPLVSGNLYSNADGDIFIYVATTCQLYNTVDGTPWAPVTFGPFGYCGDPWTDVTERYHLVPVDYPGD